MENEVRRHLRRRQPWSTSGNTWLSVITNARSFFQFCKRSPESPLSRHHNRHRIRCPADPGSICCCGRISRPFGAALSIGTTRITVSNGDSKSAASRVASRLLMTVRRAICSFNSLDALVRGAHTGRYVPQSGFCSDFPVSRSHLIVNHQIRDLASTRTARIALFFRLPIPVSPRPPPGPPRSALFQDLTSSFRLAFTPSSPSSSIPGVSMITTGPSGRQLHRFIDRIGRRPPDSPTRSPAPARSPHSTRRSIFPHFSVQKSAICTRSAGRRLIHSHC